MSPSVLLLSIRQEYANMIFDGTKQVELRRVRPKYLEQGDLILVYVTSPKQALVGVLEVEKVIEETPKKLWRIVKKKAGIASDNFQKYYEDSSTAFAIFIRKTYRFDNPIQLKQLREEWVDFHPPQCYRYLKDNEIKLVESLTHYDIIGVSDKPKIYQTELLSVG